MSQRNSARIYKNRKPLRDIVIDEIRSRIFDGRLEPGERLVERNLAAEFNTSRHPVREALRVLQREGLVTSSQSRGLVVSTLSKKEVEDLFGIRRALEGFAMREVVKNSGNVDITLLKSHLDAARKALEAGKKTEALNFNTKFHDDIVTLSGNGLLHNILEPLTSRLHWLYRQILDIELVTQEHEYMYLAIASGSADRAEAAAQAHVEKYRQLTLNYLFPKADQTTQN